MITLCAEIAIWSCCIRTPARQWLLEESENELPTETVAKATRTGQIVRSSFMGREEGRKKGRLEVQDQVSEEMGVMYRELVWI